MTTTDIPAIDEAKLEAFVGQAVTDMGAAISGLLLHIGDRLGLYKAMAGAGPITSSDLAQRTGTTERYVREWLGNQAAGGYVVYDPADGTYELPAEQAMVVANEDSPVFLGGAFEAIASCYADHDVFVDAFRTGAGVGWHEHDDRLFSGVAAALPSRLRRPPRRGVAAGPGRRGGQAAGGRERRRCGVRARRLHGHHGAGVRALDVRRLRRPRAVDRGRPRGRGAGRRAASGRGSSVAAAKDLPGEGYDLVCLFDALHDMGDPVGAARRIRQALAPDGTLLLVEPYAGDTLEDNLNPVGRTYYGLSTVDLHAGLAGPGGRAGTRRAGR